MEHEKALGLALEDQRAGGLWRVEALLRVRARLRGCRRLRLRVWLRMRPLVWVCEGRRLGTAA